MVVRKQVNSIIKYEVAQKLLFKTKGPYRVVEKATPSSYWLRYFPFYGGIGRPGIKVKESAARLEYIPSTMVLHKHLDGTDTVFFTMSAPLVKENLGEWLRVIRRGTHQAASEDIRWAY